ncbi:MAG: MFS transporter [Lachnospirales bacterium]
MINKQHLKFYLVSRFLNEFARTLPHAVLTIIFLSKGINIEEVAIIQIFFMAAIIFFELPSGIISDIYSRKFIYILSTFTLLISNYMVVIASSYFNLCISWFIYGISTALSTGSLDSSFANIFKKEEDIIFKKHLSNLQITTSVSAISAGVIGGYLYNFIEINIYYISIVFLLISIFIVITAIPSKEDTEQINGDYRTQYS